MKIMVAARGRGARAGGTTHEVLLPSCKLCLCSSRNEVKCETGASFRDGGDSLYRRVFPPRCYWHDDVHTLNSK